MRSASGRSSTVSRTSWVLINHLLFSLPMLLTMELWWFGFTMPASHMAVLLLITLPTLMGLAYYSGVENPRGLL